MRKHLIVLLTGLALVLIGIACFYIETMNYNVSSTLTSNFTLKQKVLEYEINEEQKFRITNDGTDKNIKLYIDNRLLNDVRIEVVHADILKIDSEYDTKVYNDKEIININLESDLMLDWDSISDFYNLTIESLNNKTVYNYSLLKYPLIKVYVNEDYRSNIEFVDNYGKTYNPIR